ncbi:PQQ-dependent sugar dehydrogenase [Fibrella aquatilis]|uniref:PQQ-dependent sugar dehydrogenase n=1 Tax=Fibrella aquatilis TaxID=2817059 RepID=A0A939G7K3_9BACT|nr:PQQ-dependent sugar dehydrogenase [Fibrella aquatilis]MBO0933664.1 PQQ-dependent sugar dehydrogenase [Fibrella aquatilis]
MNLFFLTCYLRWHTLVSFIFLLVNYTSVLAQTDTAASQLFEKNCAGCHNFKQDGIGPQLGGLKGNVDERYLVDFIKNPKAMIDARHARAVDKYKKFGTVMPAFTHLGDKAINELVAYLLVKPAPVTMASTGPAGLENPIPEPIGPPTMDVSIQRVLQFPFTNATQPRTRINKMGVHPITKETMVADLQGPLYILSAANEATVYFDARTYFSRFTNNPGLATGLGSFAFHPDFATNRLFYTTHTEPANTSNADFAYADSIPVKLQWVVNEWVVDNAGARQLTGKPRELLRINVVTQIHGMQDITFNPYAKPTDADYGLLYIGMGDGGAVEQGYPFIARNKNSVWGKVLRINPTERTSKNGQYGIPATNPFVNKDGLDEVYAEGFRNPNRITWLRDGRMLVSNIGQRQIESIYVVKPGKNHGWPDREGTFMVDVSTSVNRVMPLPKTDKSLGYSYPVIQFDHDEGNAIMGGYEYTGNQVPQLKGSYVFGEIVRGRVFYVNVKDISEGKQATIHECQLVLNGQKTTLKELTNENKIDLRLGQDAAGELYVFTKSDGMMYKLVK